MSEVIKTATRDAYGKALVELGNSDAKVLVLDADLAAATKTGMFKKEHPEKFIDCGIAEGNMMGIAAGLATSGYTVFASSFAMFAAGRAFEQVRNSIAYPKLNVKIGATHAGISVGEDGATHQCLEDLGIMRTLPNMIILNPADDIESKGTSEIFSRLRKDEELQPLVEKLCEFLQKTSIEDLEPLENATISKVDSIADKWKRGNGYIPTPKKGKVEDPDNITAKWSGGNGYVAPKKQDPEELIQNISSKFKRPE